MPKHETYIQVAGVLERSWSMPPSQQYPEPSAGAELLVSGRAIRLYGPGMTALVGVPEGTRVVVRCVPRIVQDRWGKDAFRLSPFAAAVVPDQEGGQ
jgi:hypothetical protein